MKRKGANYKQLTITAVWLLLWGLLSGCEEQQPIKIGFIGGTSGKVADLGIAGRNGVLLAFEERNKAGGINGQPVELLLKDDQQDAALARQSAKELVALNVAAIIGPMTSSMALEVQSVTQLSGTLTMGVTPSTNELTGKNDNFFRTVSTTREHASEMANYLRKSKHSERIAIIYDLKNKSYSESWSKDFSKVFNALGGRGVSSHSFLSSAQIKFEQIVKTAMESKPDTVLLITNSVDASLLAKQIKTLNPGTQIASSEWAGTERLIQLGGRYVERLVVTQLFDRESKNVDYQLFQQAYIARYGHLPGFPGLIGFNAANVVLDGLAAQKEGESLKQTLLRIKTFNGVPESIVFDAFGDAKGKSYITEIIDGQFQVRASL